MRIAITEQLINANTKEEQEDIYREIIFPTVHSKQLDRRKPHFEAELQSIKAPDITVEELEGKYYSRSKKGSSKRKLELSKKLKQDKYKDLAKKLRTAQGETVFTLQ